MYSVSILYKSTAGRHRPVSYPDGPITARCRFIKHASWVQLSEMAAVIPSGRPLVVFVYVFCKNNLSITSLWNQHCQSIRESFSTQIRHTVMSLGQTASLWSTDSPGLIPGSWARMPEYNVFFYILDCRYSVKKCHVQHWSWSSRWVWMGVPKIDNQ